MRATLNILTNPFHPALDKIQAPITRRVKVKTLVKRYNISTDRPVLCYYNGSPILRADWERTYVKHDDVVTFAYLPQGGGGGSNPLRLILTIALAVAMPGIGAALGGALGAGALGTSLLTAGVGLLGNVLINALIPPPQLPRNQQSNQLSSPSPTYTIGAQGNQARIGQPIPVLYGKMRVYPDFAAQPYAEFENNEQYLYQLFCISQGSLDIDTSTIQIEDSPISSFGADFITEIIQPNTSSTLFPRDVYNVSEVAGQELLGDGTTTGYFVANPTTTLVNKAAFDVVLPKGLGYINDNGGTDGRTVTVKFLAQKINDSGQAQGAPITLGQEAISGATSTSIRKTYSYTLASGRYSLAIQRIGVKDDNTRTANDVIWSSARTYSANNRVYGDTTLLAIKIRATNAVSQQSARKINLIATRKLEIPTYNATTNAYEWSARTATRSPAWAIADMCRAAYGAGVTEARFDVAQLVQLEAFWSTRKNASNVLSPDLFNGVFDSTQTFWESLTSVCRAGRCRPYIQGGMIHFFRDSLQTLPTALFTSRNIVKGSFKINYVMPSADSSDCVDVEYFDEVIWKSRVVRAAIDVAIQKKPTKIKAFGITSREQAYREGMYAAASNRFRRKEISFETELEGYIPSLGDLIAVQSDIPEWGQFGEVGSFAGGTIVSTQPFTWTEGATHYVMLRRKNGSALGPITVTRGDTDSILLFNQASLDFTPYDGFEKERTHISFGKAGQVVQLARVLTTVPRDRTVQITAINEDARVHSADGTNVPADIFEWSLSIPKIRPILGDFSLTQIGSGSNPSISVSWTPTSGASKYIIEKSVDNINWETLGEVSGSTFSFLANIGLLYVRVAAYGGVIGPYVTKSIQVGSIAPPANVATGTITSTGLSFDVKWSTVTDCDGYLVEIFNAGSLKRSFTTTSTQFNYSLENAIADGGPWRTININIRAKKNSVYSLTPLVLTGTNAAPGAPTIAANGGAGTVSVTVSRCTDLDYAGTLIFASTTSGFTPGPSNQIYDGSSGFFMHQTLVQTYYKAAHYDTYGKNGLNYSSEYVASPSASIGISLQYSSNGTSWHSTYVTGDIYMRQRVDAGEWSDAIPFVGPAGANGAAGANGTNGDSRRICYSKTSLTSLSGTPTTISVNGSTAFPPNDSWGAGTVWSDTAPTLVAGESQYQSDGIYSVAANKTIWGKPYLTSLKVARLDAIAVNTGDLTAQKINVDNTGWIAGGMSAFGTGSGFWAGYDVDAYKFFVGSQSGQFISFDGTKISISSTNLTLNEDGLTISGGGVFSGSLSGANGTFTGALLGATGEFAGSLRAGVLDMSSFGGRAFEYNRSNNPSGLVFTVPANMTRMRLTLVGGGGGGGRSIYIYHGVPRDLGNGGQAAQEAKNTFTVTPGASYYIAIGQGGAGGGTYGAADGTSGTATAVYNYDTTTNSLGSLVLASNGGAYAGANNAYTTYTRTRQVSNPLNGSTTTVTDTYYHRLYTSQPDTTSQYTICGENNVYGQGGIGYVFSSQAPTQPTGYGTGGAGSQTVSISGSPDISSPATAGRDGRGLVEFFNPNSVVLQANYDALKQTLRSQGLNVTDTAA